ncbi:MarR family winged helix-turn-helix transcriptional regulator [Jatrophihabitans endophyticus]|uniref:MarR family winged helix-turn-helix transcriptional regulator n=1 Tax=Jatrophihabitans endophyticus TaxID=1206085 RepID=UPI0019EFA94C|nr:MarR family transcriptional regulator [Jatrophihabitans endophyticus]MBE7188066.1 MarR family transcriptional regulator [Jatrophihabitans endophyticus]
MTQTVQWLDDREQSAWRSFLHMHAQLTAQLGRELQESSNLSISDYSVLVQLSDQPDQRVRILELARALQWEKSRLSHQLTRMQQRGLLERSSCKEDRRGAFVVLTDAGREALEAVAPAHVASVRRYLFDDLSLEQLEVFTAVCDGVLERLPHCDAQSDAALCGEPSGASAG